MEILHAFWQPDTADAVARGGRFPLWVETDLSPKPASPRKTKQRKAHNQRL